jgi:hypothetical protein
VYVSNVKLPTYTLSTGRTITIASTSSGTAAPVFA